MAYSKEVISRARTILAQQKADRESQIAARQEQAYKQVPRLEEIRLQLRSTMSAAAKAVFEENGDAQAAMARIREKNLALQAEQKALEQAHFAPGWLDDSPICRTCGGSGYVGSTMCDCLKALCRQEQSKALDAILGSDSRFETFRLDLYSDAVLPHIGAAPRRVMEKNLEVCRRYARSFAQGAGNLLFNGGTGLGKTHLAQAIGRAVGEQGYSVCYAPAIDLFTKLERAKFTPTEENRREAEDIEQCDLLIIDDLGTEMTGQFTVAALYGLLNRRLREHKSMVITTNLNVQDAAGRYSAQIASRLYGDFQRLTFLGEDIRIRRNAL